jgi:hypothetical protein
MRLKIIAVVLSIVVAVSLGLLAYDRISQANGEKPKIRVSNFSVADPDVLAWGWVYWRFNVTIENYGNLDANNVTLRVTMINNETKTNLWNYSTDFEIIQAGTQKNISQGVQTDMIAWYAWFEKFSVERPQNVVFYNASILLGNKIIDEKIVT